MVIPLDRSRASAAKWTSWLAMLGLLGALVALLSGCASSSPATPRVTCTVQIAPGGVDVAQALLRCTVSNAPTSDTKFTLHYALVDDAGKAQPPFDATCDGALAQGTGACQQTYSVVAPRSPTDSSISGESLPGHTALGPVAPVETSSVSAFIADGIPAS
jgi:hypothetical protein